MNAFPDVYLSTYVEGFAPWVKAGDLMAMQTEAIRVWKAARGGDFLFADDFVGAVVNLSNWTVSGTVGTTFPAGAMGAIYLGLAAVTNKIVSNVLAFGQNPIRFNALFSHDSVAAGTFSTFVGIFSATAANKLGFISDNTGANWNFQKGAAVFATSIPRTAAFQRLEIRRENGFVTGLIDGVVAFGPSAHTVNITDGVMKVELITNNAANDVICDYVKCWCERLPIAATAGGAAAGQHVELQEITFAGAGGVDMTFTSAFPDTAYKVLNGPPLVGAGTPPTFRVVRAVDKMTITPSASFTGTCCFLACE